MAQSGGALSFLSSDGISNGDTFRGGRATSGAAVDVSGSHLQLWGAIFEDNRAVGTGTLLLRSQSKASLVNATLSSNSATNGGGVAVQDSAISIANTTFIGNSATGSGAALHLE